MSRLYASLKGRDTYYDRRSANSLEEWKAKVARSCVVYVGNLNFSTTEDELYEVFSHAGLVRRVVMGLNRQTRSPCGFAFVEYFRPRSAQVAIAVLNGCNCDGRVIRVDADSGEDIDGDRKYGRGFTGRQWRDEYREEYDVGRGGEGRKRAREEHGFDPSNPVLYAAPMHALPNAAGLFPAQPVGAFVSGAVVANDNLPPWSRNVRAKTAVPPPPGVLSTEPAFALPVSAQAVAPGSGGAAGFGSYLQLVGNAQNGNDRRNPRGHNPFAAAGTGFFKGGGGRRGGRRR
ncbi:putative nuclear cap-binding protein [Neospora caninum Liverpool]|uniref:Nuclear cap-binding protein subunit 2 n=1 Tax=Neospora caninum (strain Liverpool) TaxID=572307 RepID=F0VBX2_NEOCL|nr:putative nuclear cap-binding protein [Neospora caninum Liverpool]CBZ51106.1 putative nuclear cap-binding protein [Neospora caninum Liverpool]CEL68413.1 TPA: nuclear cap-binding protein, putative [Neospora caninum Liverpool]|eukprot:XP_003881139.1 putative nuclear cap-binding protein [Neospora caninum Liverpool]